jgi:hypothetical protein
MKKTIAAAVAAAALLGAAPAAHAEEFLSKRQAQSDARQAAGIRYGKARYSVLCRPHGLEAPAPGYLYRVWVCDWFDDYNCRGTLRIEGKRGAGWYWHRIIHGQRCYE